MIGFVTTPQTAEILLESIKQAQIANGRPHYWTTGAEPIFTGEHAGKMFVPAGEEVLSAPLRNGLTPRDFPEFDQLITLLGGLEDRVEIDIEDLIDPDFPADPQLEE